MPISGLRSASYIGANTRPKVLINAFTLNHYFFVYIFIFHKLFKFMRTVDWFFEKKTEHNEKNES